LFAWYTCPLLDRFLPGGDNVPSMRGQRMPQPTTALDALLGLLAVRTNFLTPEALTAALEASAKGESRSLEEFLVSRRLLQAKEAAALKVLAEGQLARHGNDSAKTLATLHRPETGTPPASRAGSLPHDHFRTRMSADA